MTIARHPAPTIAAFSIAIFMLFAVHAAGVTGIANTMAVMVAVGAAMTTATVALAARRMGVPTAPHRTTRLLLETAGMISLAVPVTTITSLMLGWR